MVFFHTSSNIRMIQNILIDFEASKETSPYEYMKIYIEKCPDTIEDSKISWIVSSFLGIQKHKRFLKELASHLSEQLSEEEQDYFMIILYGLIFQITVKDMQSLYKCLFNLSKPLLSTLTDFLGNNEVLTFISQMAAPDFDTKYITDKIISPLFEWQPYISEMGHNYSEYLKKVESRKMKPLTVPIQPNVLNRKAKDTLSVHTQPAFPVTPPNSHSKAKMLTKSAIDRRLKNIHEKNKQTATNLLNDVKNNDPHYAQTKTEKYYKTVAEIQEQVESNFGKQTLTFDPHTKAKIALKTPAIPIKDNVATIKRLNKRIQLEEQEEMKWLENIVNDFRNITKFEEIEEFDRQEKERERLLDIEKKHLQCQISFEEAVIAKKKVREDNKKGYQEFLKGKEGWNEEIEKWKREQIEECRKKVEKLSVLELNVLEAKNAHAQRRKEAAEKIKKESDLLIAKAMKLKQEELERKIKMIKEIKVLSLIAKKAKVPKIVDLTESSRFGFLSEMSIAELQERLSAMKIGIKEELDRKKALIAEENLATKQDLEETRKTIKNFFDERKIQRKVMKKKRTLTNSQNLPAKEISDLKKTLEERRRLRRKLTN